MKEHRIDGKVLLEVIEKMKKIGLIPTGYHYPELCSSDDFSQKLRRLKERKETHERHH